MHGTVKYPHIVVKLVGQDGNAFSILGNVKKALRREGVPQEEIEAFVTEATSDDYNHLLAVVQETVTVE
jgi:hypothetical protein